MQSMVRSSLWKWGDASQGAIPLNNVICPNICCMFHPAIIHLGGKVKVRNQIVPMFVSSSYPSGAADRQDVQLHLTVRSSAEGKEPVCPTHQTPALGEKPLWSGFKLIHEHQLTGRHETPQCPACKAPSRNMCFHLVQIPQHVEWSGRVGGGGLKPEIPLNITVSLSGFLHWPYDFCRGF